MSEQLTVFGEVLQAFMERAGVSGPIELVQRMHEEGYDRISEEILIEEMYGTYEETEEGRPALIFTGGDEILGMNEDEISLLAQTHLMNYEPASLEARELWWKVKRAMARRQITPLEELTEEEAFSEQK